MKRIVVSFLKKLVAKERANKLFCECPPFQHREYIRPLYSIVNSKFIPSKEKPYSKCCTCGLIVK